MRRHFHHILMVIAAIAMAVACSSKFDDPDASPTYHYPNNLSSSEDENGGASDGAYNAVPGGKYTAVVTVKKDEAGEVYLWFGGKFRLDPLVSVPYEHQYRAMAMLLQQSDIEDGRAPVNVEWLEPVDDGIFTTDTSVKGSDGIDLKLDSWITTSDDGYLTLHYSTKWGRHPVHHDFYLVAGTDPIRPYTLELRHNANGDPKEEEGEGIINFDLNSLPSTGETTVIIQLKWTNSAGLAETANFEFKTRK